VTQRKLETWLNNLEAAHRGLKQLTHAKGKAERDKCIQAAWEKTFDALSLSNQVSVIIARNKLAEEVRGLGTKGATEIVMWIGALWDERNFTGK